MISSGVRTKTKYIFFFCFWVVKANNITLIIHNFSGKKNLIALTEINSIKHLLYLSVRLYLEKQKKINTE